MATVDDIIKQWIIDGNMTTTLNLLGKNLTKLPDIPENCRKLDCSHNKLTELPDLPYITSLDCSGNDISKIGNLTNCEELRCTYNVLETLPELPKCRLLYCSHNKLKALPKLPNCVDLSCKNNYLEQLPELPKCRELWCNDNFLRDLPELPCIVELDCSDNKRLTKLPDLPNCDRLSFTGSRIYVLPKLHKNVLINSHHNYLAGVSLRRYNDKKEYINTLFHYNSSDIDAYMTNYNKFASKIQNRWHEYMKAKIFKELQKIYIKNVSLVVSWYC